jgi:hypothetical protein
MTVYDIDPPQNTTLKDLSERYPIEFKVEFIQLCVLYEELGEIDTPNVREFNEQLRTGLVSIVESIEENFPGVTCSLSSLELIDEEHVPDEELGTAYTNVGENLGEIEVLFYR